MQQTLYDLDPSAAFSVDDTATIFTEIPDIAVVYARVIAGWSVVESFIGLAATSLMAGRAEVAMAMYEAISDSAAQNNGLIAAADVALSSDDAKLFKLVLRKIRKLGKVRHQLAHGVVIHSAALIDGFAVAEQRHFVQMTKVFFTPPRPGEAREDQVRRLTAVLLRSAIVFRKEDLVTALADIEAASSLASDLGVLAAPFHHNREEARAKLLDAVGKDTGSL